MMRWSAALYVAGLGAVIAIGGLLYGVLTVGVPHPEPTLAQAAAEKSHLAISSWAMGGGIVVFVIGLLLFLAVAIVRAVAWIGVQRDALDSRSRRE